MQQVILKGWVVLYRFNGELRLVASCKDGEINKLSNHIRLSNGDVVAVMQADHFNDAVIRGLESVVADLEFGDDDK